MRNDFIQDPSRNMEEDRIISTKMHVYVLYIAFFVFLYVSWSLVTGFLPQLPELPPESVPYMGNIAFAGVDKPRKWRCKTWNKT
jgi:hypothetical protein